MNYAASILLLLNATCMLVCGITMCVDAFFGGFRIKHAEKIVDVSFALGTAFLFAGIAMQVACGTG